MTDGADAVSTGSRVFLSVNHVSVAVNVRVLSLDFADAIENELFLSQAGVRNASDRQSFAIFLLEFVVGRAPALFLPEASTILFPLK